MNNDNYLIFEKYLEVINEASWKGRRSMSDRFQSNFHRQLKTFSPTAGSPEAQSLYIGKTPALQKSEIDDIRGMNYEQILNYNRENNEYFPYIGNESILSKKAQKEFEKYNKQYPNKYSTENINGNIVILYWDVPSAINSFSAQAKNPDIISKSSYLELLKGLYSILQDEDSFKKVYKNSLPIIIDDKLFKLDEMFSEHKEKIDNAINSLNSKKIPEKFLEENSTYPRKIQTRGGQTTSVSIPFFSSEKDRGQFAFGQGENEPISSATPVGKGLSKPPVGYVKKGEELRKDLKKIRATEETPTTLPSLGKQPEPSTPKPSSKRKPKRKVKKESYEPFIKLIPF